MTETELYHAWRGLEAVSRSRMDNMAQLAAAVAPAMSCLEKGLNELGYSIVGNQLVETAVTEKPPEEMLPAPPEIDNTLPPEGTDPPLGGEPPVVDNTLPPEGAPAAAQQSSGMFRRRK